MSIPPALRRLRQEDHELKAILGYTVRSCLKQRNKQTNNNKKPTLSVAAVLMSRRKMMPEGKSSAEKSASGSLHFKG
jgi:hypothetical protein